MKLTILKSAPLLALCLLVNSPQGAAQTTCNTDPNGATLCSTPEGVIRGYTSTLGDSVFRDEQGNRVDYEVDQFGNASVELPSGKTINYSQTQNTIRDKMLRNIKPTDPVANNPLPTPGLSPMPGPVPLGLGGNP